MQPSYGACALALLSFVAYSQALSSKKISSELRPQFFRRGVDDNRVDHNFAGKEGACKESEYRKAFQEQVKKVQCGEPRDKLVKLVTSNPDIVFIPGHVSVKRCEGDCAMSLSCIPSSTRNVTVSVRQRNRLTNEITCGQVHVEEHVRCMCKCTVMQSHCISKQVYRSSECMCHCMNQDEKISCQEMGKSWNMDKCECECPNSRSMDCSTGLEWVPSKCMCMRVTDAVR